MWYADFFSELSRDTGEELAQLSKPPGIPNELFAYERKKRQWAQKDVADEIGAPVDERTIRRWESGDTVPTPHYRSKLAEVFGKSARELGFPPDGQIPFWHMPYRRNAFFTGRDDSLQLLRDTFLAQQANPVPRLPLALSGLGGVGKSHIALEYAYRYREHYHTVLWLHAASYQDLVADVTAVADLLDLPGRDAATSDQLIDALKEWLTQLTRWLLIFDNVEDFQLLEGFLPAEIKGHVLLTTLSQDTGTHALRIAVEPMDNNTGAELLLRRAKLIAIERTLEHLAAADAATARSLSEDMGGLALALDQAGAYIEETGVSLSEYVQRYQAERSYLLNRRGSLVREYSEHPDSVAVTLGLSIKSAGEQHSLATDILYFCAFLQPDTIPAELFQHDGSFKYGTTAFDDGVAALLRYSLIRRNTPEKTFSMHRLVQAVLIEDMADMAPDLQTQWRERVIQALIAAFPYPDFKGWGQCERLVSHVLACAAWTKDELTPTVGAGELFHKACIYLSKRGQYPDAESLLDTVLSIYKQHFGVDYPDTASALNELAAIYHVQGKYSLAEPRYEQALTIMEKLLGANQPDTLKIMHNLAVLYLSQGKLDKAEPLLVRVLSIRAKLLGTKHPDTASSLHMLAVLYSEQGKTDQAALLFLQALSILETHLGSEHPDIAHPLHGLAMLLRSQGYERAEVLYQQALHIQERQLGADHPDIHNIKMSYANLLQRIGRDAEAAALEVNDDTSI